jgi:hypothetical protein
MEILAGIVLKAFSHCANHRAQTAVDAACPQGRQV